MNLCDECLGRMFLDVEGQTNKERGKKVRRTAGMNDVEKCELCENIFDKLEDIGKEISKELIGYEYRTFRIGTRVPIKIKLREEKAWEEYGVKNTESIKKNVNRELGKILEKLTGKKYSNTPDIEIIVNPWKGTFEIHPAPLYIYGRYRKYAEMPQTKWPCRYCLGKGCEKCEYTGRQWRETIEDIMADVLIGITLGKRTKMHAAGREDIDAKMLGNGRPFVIEILHPRKRNIDLELVKREINNHGEGKIEILCLMPSGKEEVRSLKSSKFDKKYVIKMKVENPEALKKIEAFSGKIIFQRTPSRVLHRKGDKIRRKKVKSVRILKPGEICTVEVIAESGLYIKELATGDNGRTKPSFSDVVGNVDVIELDIVGVEGGRECR